MNRILARSVVLHVLCVAVACAALAACAAPRAVVSDPSDAHVAARPIPALEQAVSVWDSRAGEALAFSALLDRLARLDVVFVGETHVDDTTHRVEVAVLAGVRERKAGAVVLSMEMFERDVQPVLDDYLAGRIDERAFLAAARPWSNYASDYRPLIEYAKAHAIPVIAANAPAALRRRVSAGGRAALDGLAPDERRLLPSEIFPADAAYWERVDRATRGHMNFARLPEEQRLFTGQNLWDNTMGAAVAATLAAHPGATVVHVVGGFHVMYRDGTVAQLARRAPDARVAVVEVLPVPGLHAARPERDAERADYLVYASELARSLSDGTYAVSVPAELRYTLDVPPSASDAERAPLVVWLSDAGERAADARELLRAEFGDEAALAVVEPPVPERADDLAPSGRWATAGAFTSDQARVAHGLERLVESVTRRFPVAGERVVIAGRGLGATAVLWCAMESDWLEAEFLAVEPRGARALQMEGLPERAPATRALRVLVPAGAEADSAWLADDFRTLGTPVELATMAADPATAIERALRAALALPPRAPSAAEPVLCVIERELPRARQWAEIHARRLEHAGHPARVVAAAELRGDEDPARVEHLCVGGLWPLASFAAGQGLPLAEGDFGGTTVLVVPPGTAPAECEAWRALEREKVLKKRSPFADLRVALSDAEPRLPQVVTELRSAGARSVLIVPATFCASPAEMRALADSLGEDAGELDIAWLPGLGGELCCAPPED